MMTEDLFQLVGIWSEIDPEFQLSLINGFQERIRPRG